MHIVWKSIVSCSRWKRVRRLRISHGTAIRISKSCNGCPQRKEAEKLFADEPTGALNKQSSHEVMEELNRIHKEGTSILLVTHDMKVASRCDRVLYIEDGNIRDEMQLGAWEDCTDIRKRERRLNEWLITLGW